MTAPSRRRRKKGLSLRQHVDPFARAFEEDRSNTCCRRRTWFSCIGVRDDVLERQVPGVSDAAVVGRALRARPDPRCVSVGGLPRACDGVPDGGPVRAPRPRAVRDLGGVVRPGDQRRDARKARGRVRPFRRRAHAHRPRGRAAAARARDRHRGRPQGLHLRQPPRNSCAAAGAVAGQLPGLPGHDGRRLARLPHRRRPSWCRRRPIAWYAERIVTLPDSYQANDDTRGIASGHADARATKDCPASGFVFCSFNNSYKITPPVFDVWMRLLDAGAGQRALAARKATRWRRPTCAARRPRAGSRPSASCSRRAATSPSIWPGIGSPICSSTRCPSTRTRRRATRCGRACRS